MSVGRLSLCAGLWRWNASAQTAADSARRCKSCTLPTLIKVRVNMKTNRRTSEFLVRTSAAEGTQVNRPLPSGNAQLHLLQVCFVTLQSPHTHTHTPSLPPPPPPPPPNPQCHNYNKEINYLLIGLTAILVGEPWDSRTITFLMLPSIRATSMNTSTSNELLK